MQLFSRLFLWFFIVVVELILLILFIEMLPSGRYLSVGDYVSVGCFVGFNSLLILLNKNKIKEKIKYNQLCFFLMLTGIVLVVIYYRREETILLVALSMFVWVLIDSTVKFFMSKRNRGELYPLTSSNNSPSQNNKHNNWQEFEPKKTLKKNAQIENKATYIIIAIIVLAFVFIVFNYILNGLTYSR